MRATGNIARLPLGEELLERGDISSDQLDVALYEQRRQRAMLGETLIRLGFISDSILAEALGERGGIPVADMAAADPDPILLERFPRAVAERRRVLPLEINSEGVIFLAMADPLDIPAIDEARRHFPDAAKIVPVSAPLSGVMEAINRCYGLSSPLDGILLEIENKRTLEAAQRSPDHPVIRMVDAILHGAAREGASDVHLEPEENFVRVRYRIDGVLREARTLHLSHWPALSHRIKIMAGMNIADTRGIQDGRFRMSLDGRDIDCRAAIMPTISGENIVVRILDNRRAFLPLEGLGLASGCVDSLIKAISKPHGITLVTGPTGSGKTTTLHALLRRLSRVDVKIATLEEPVEYQPGLIRQTAVQEDLGIGFAEGVRGVLRMDPDIILIGEIRDPDTAQMALRAAMTGHKIFSTLHCPNALGALPRLLDLGISTRTLAGNLSAITAQRLVRKLCPFCATQRLACAEECAAMRLDASRPPIIAEAAGCDECSGSGRRGRTALSEVLLVTPEIDSMIAAGADKGSLLDAAAQQGFKNMREDGIDRVLSREISLSDLRQSVDLG